MLPIARNDLAHVFDFPAPKATRIAWPDHSRCLILVIGGPAQLQLIRSLMSQAGARSSGVASALAARQACAHIRFDAIAAHRSALGPKLAHSVSELRQWFGGALMVIADDMDESDEVLALEHGANAYVTMQMAPRLLLARLMACMHEPAGPPQGRIPQCAARRLPDERAGALATHPLDMVELPGQWRFDLAASALRRGSRELPLTELQLALLECLANPVGRVVARAELQARMGSKAEAIKRHTVEVYIFRLRQRLARYGLDAFHIEAVWRRGYRLQATVVQVT